MSKERSKYICIGCDLYDRLELLAMRATSVELIYKDEKNQLVKAYHTIKDLETKNKEEFLITKSGLRLRLDKVLNLDVL
jgi:transcriptional antiterminator Rof (Rho-off)